MGIFSGLFKSRDKASDYFAAVVKGTLMRFAVDGKETGSILLR